MIDPRLLIRPALLAAAVMLACCTPELTPEQRAYIASVEKSRAEKDEWMRNDPSSPFRQDTAARFEPLKYFPPDPAFVFTSRLFEYAAKETVVILGTKGEERKVERFGYVVWNRAGIERRINVYHGISRHRTEYHSIWFTDRTTGKETYGVGRYIDFTRDPDPEHLYTVDFNGAYNPYCAYSSRFSCAVPTNEDFIDTEITAGEKTFH